MTALEAHGAAFARAVATFGPAAPAILCHDDADGLSAGAILAHAFTRAGHDTPRPRIVGRGEGAWSAELRAELTRGAPIDGLVVTDLGVEGGPILPGTPTILIDHHVPRSQPAEPETTVVTGHADTPAPTSSLLAFACAQALIGHEAAGDLAWLAAIGLVGDLGEREASAAFPELMQTVKRAHTLKALREAVSLVNAPRRTRASDARPALALLMKADGPRDVLSGQHPETDVLRAAQAEVKEALGMARAVAPVFAGPVALIRLHSACQIHALVAQSWTHRLSRQVVIAMNDGFREGYVHFVARSAGVPDLIAFLEARAPALGPGDQFAQGHRRATGGQVRIETWNRFAEGLGFGPEALVAHESGDG